MNPLKRPKKGYKSSKIHPKMTKNCVKLPTNVKKSPDIKKYRQITTENLIKWPKSTSKHKIMPKKHQKTAKNTKNECHW